MRRWRRRRLCGRRQRLWGKWRLSLLVHVGRAPHNVVSVHLEFVVPLADHLVVSFAAADVLLVVVDGVPGQAVTLLVKLYCTVGNVYRKGNRNLSNQR
jgi:hypothetical protein